MNNSKLTKLYLVAPSVLDRIKSTKMPTKSKPRKTKEGNVDYFKLWKKEQQQFKPKPVKPNNELQNLKSLQNYLADLLKNLRNQPKTTLDDLKSAKTQTDAVNYRQNFTQTDDTDYEQEDFLKKILQLNLRK